MWKKLWGYLIEENTAPVIVGELGTKFQTLTDEMWLSSLVTYLNGDFDNDGDNDLLQGEKGS